MVGQALYRLVIFDFFFVMLGSLFGEFLSKYDFFVFHTVVESGNFRYLFFVVSLLQCDWNKVSTMAGRAGV